VTRPPQSLKLRAIDREEIMKIGRRAVLAGTGAGLAIASVPKSHGAEADNPSAGFIAADGKSITVIDVKADANGHAVISPLDLPADASPYPLFKQFLTNKASAVAIYSAPPNHHIATSFDTARRLIVVVAGALTLNSAHGSRECGTGTFIMLDGKSDVTAHGGPRGFTAIKVQLAA
jgi:hypothetical protein